MSRQTRVTCAGCPAGKRRPRPVCLDRQSLLYMLCTSIGARRRAAAAHCAAQTQRLQVA